jgi:hypothetical protein
MRLCDGSLGGDEMVNEWTHIAYDGTVLTEISVCSCTKLTNTSQYNHKPHHSCSEEPGLENQTEHHVHGNEKRIVWQVRNQANAFSSLPFHSQDLMSVCIDSLPNRSSNTPSYRITAQN